MRRTTDDFYDNVSALEQEESVLLRKTAEIRTTKFLNDRAILQAIEIPERLLATRSRLSRAARGQNQSLRAERVQDSLRTLLETYNWLATKLLQQNNLKLAFELLKRAENLTKTHSLGHSAGTAVTYNNIACYYRRIGKLRTAIRYLEAALAVEERISSADVSQTHLNLCATLSQLGKHESAMKHAYIAVMRVYEMLVPDLLVLDPSSDAIKERMAVLCIAYHNLAVEEEFLKSPSAIETYTLGLRYADKYLGPDHQIGSILKTSLEAVRKMFGTKKRRPKPAQTFTGQSGKFFDVLAFLTPRNPPNADRSDSPDPTSEREQSRSPSRECGVQPDRMLSVAVRETNRRDVGSIVQGPCHQYGADLCEDVACGNSVPYSEIGISRDVDATQDSVVYDGTHAQEDAAKTHVDDSISATVTQDVAHRAAPQDASGTPIRDAAQNPAVEESAQVALVDAVAQEAAQNDAQDPQHVPQADTAQDEAQDSPVVDLEVVTLQDEAAQESVAQDTKTDAPAESGVPEEVTQPVMHNTVTKAALDAAEVPRKHDEESVVDDATIDVASVSVSTASQPVRLRLNSTSRPTTPLQVSFRGQLKAPSPYEGKPDGIPEVPASVASDDVYEESFENE